MRSMELNCGKALLRHVMPNLLRRLSRSLSTERKKTNSVNGSANGDTPRLSPSGLISSRKSKSRDSSIQRNPLFRKKPKESLLAQATGVAKLEATGSQILAITQGEQKENDESRLRSYSEPVVRERSPSTTPQQSTASTPCAMCGVSGSTHDMVQLQSDTYLHTQCFTCHQCHNPLQPGNYSKFRGVLLCESDYALEMSRLAPRVSVKPCLVCGDSIAAGRPGEGPPVMIRGRGVHGRCFVCGNCGRTPSQPNMVTIKDRQILCCEGAQPEKKCNACGLSIKSGEPIHTNGEKHWHRMCFRCVKCSLVISDEVYMHEGQQHCLRCYKRFCNLTCSTCDQLVIGAVINVGTKRYHPRCAFCCVCGGHFSQASDPSQMVTEGEEIWHPKCSALRKSIRQMENFLVGTGSNTSPAPQFGSRNFSAGNTNTLSATLGRPRATTISVISRPSPQSPVETENRDVTGRLGTSSYEQVRVRKSFTFSAGEGDTNLIGNPVNDKFSNTQINPPQFACRGRPLRVHRSQNGGGGHRRRGLSRAVAQQPTIVESELENEEYKYERSRSCPYDRTIRLP